MTAKQRDEMLLQRMKDKMGAEGDQGECLGELVHAYTALTIYISYVFLWHAAWEDGRPAESGLPRHVKNNMFRII
jgi:hypothetical protein